MNKPFDLAKIFPIQSIENDVLVNGNGDLTIGYSLMLPEVYTLSIEKYNSLQESLVSLFSRLPAGTLIHKQDFFYLDNFNADYTTANQYTKKNQLRYVDQKPVLRHYSNLYFTVSSRTEFSVGGKKNSFTGLLDFVFKKPFKDLSRQLAEVKRIVTAVEPGLNAIMGLKAKRMDNNSLLSALHDLWNLSYDKPTLEADGKTLQPWEFEKELKIGDQYVQILSLVEEGNELWPAKKDVKTSDGNMYNNGNSYSNSINLPCSLTFPVGLGLPVNHILNTTIEILDYPWLSNHLEIEKRKYNFLATPGYKPAQRKVEEIEYFLEILSKGDLTPCRASVNVILHDKSFDRLENYVSLTETAFSNMNQSKVWKENFDCGNLFVCSTPGNMKNNYRGFISSVPQAINYFTKETHYKSDPAGNLFVDRFGNPCTVDMWDSPYITNNRNKLVFGPSGTGKSVLINGLVDESLYNGNHVILLDIGGSYRKNCSLNEGLYFDAADKTKLSFNIFLCEQDSEGNYLYNIDEDGQTSDDKINFVYSIIAYIWKGKNEHISKPEKVLLRSMISAFYEHINSKKIFPNLIEFYHFIPVYENTMDPRDKEFINLRSLQITLDSFVSGEYQYLLNSQTNIQLKDIPYIVFDVEAIQKNEDIRDIVSIILIELVIEKTAALPLNVRKSFIIDEAIDFLMGGDMADFIGGMFRKIRKKGGEVYLATQDASFLEECDDLVRKSIIQNTEIKILLDHRSVKATYKTLRELLSFTDSDIELLDSIENGPDYREFFIKINNVSRVFRNVLSPEALAVYTTTANDLAEIEALYNKYGHLGAAINQYVENKKQRYEKVS